MITPLVTNLKLDPFERFHEARGFDDWQEDRAWTSTPAFELAGKLIAPLNEYKSRRASFVLNIDDAMKALNSSSGN